MRFFVFAALLALPAAAAPVITSTFPTDSEGWSVVDDGTSTAVVFTGSAIRHTDVTTGYFHFVAPAAFLGDRSAFAGGTLSYDLLQTTAGSDTTWYYREVLQGAGLLLLNTDPLAPDTANWVHRTVSLSAGTWIVIPTIEDYTGPAATAGQFAAVLANLTGLYITGDLISGIGDVATLDNVQLAAVPEPSFGWMVAAGLAALVSARRAAGSRARTLPAQPGRCKP